MNNEQQIAHTITSLTNLQNSLDTVSSDMGLAISSIPFLQIQKKILNFSENFYQTIKDVSLKKELIFFSNKCQCALLCGDSNEFAKNLFLQIESIVNFGLFSKITLNQINTDLQDKSKTVSFPWQQPNIKVLSDAIFGWNKNNVSNINKINNNISLDEKDISFNEKASLYNYYFFYLKQNKSYPNFDFTNTIKLIRDKNSHGQSKITDSKNLIPAFEQEFSINHYQLCHKYYQQHISRFVTAL